MGAVISSVAVLALNNQHIFLLIVLTPCCFPPMTQRRYCTIMTWCFVQLMVCLIFSASPPSSPFSILYEIAKPNYLVCIRKVFPIRSVKSGMVRKRSTRRVWRYRFCVASWGIWLDAGRSLRDRYALRPSRQNLQIRSVNGVRIES